MLSVGILTWNSPNTLRNTLTTYKTSGLLDASDDVFIVIQKSELQLEEKVVCDEFGLRSVLLPDNGKMGSGYKAIYENAKHEYLMLLENDWVIKADRDAVNYFFTNAGGFLSDGYDVVRGRSRSNPGWPNGAVSWFAHRPPEDILQGGPDYLSECMYWITDPELTFPNHIAKIDSIIPARNHGESWYTTTSKNCNHTNNPCIYKKSFYRDVILPYCVFGNSIEDQIHGIWAQQDYKCVFGFGVFTHERHDGFWRTEY
jgi:hypothetical protein